MTSLTSRYRATLFSALLVASSVMGVAAAQSGRPMMEQDIIINEAFLGSHPDLLNRLRGFHELEERNDPSRAANYFRRAARYADKTSQAMYAEMLWTGNGVEQDKAAAYAWMDLAAERGFKELLAVRERYWAELDEAERKDALNIGRKIYAEYGDDVAKPRMEQVLTKAQRSKTGTRTGSSGMNYMIVMIPGNGAWTTVGGEQFYRDEYWHPKEYWTWKDLNVEGPRRGRATAGDLHDVKTKPPGKKKPREK